MPAEWSLKYVICETFSSNENKSLMELHTFGILDKIGRNLEFPEFTIGSKCFEFDYISDDDYYYQRK